jgi:hypothetical protein
MEIVSRAAGERHLFLCIHPEAPLTAEAAEEIEFRASEEKIVLHGILPDGPEDAAAVARLCRRSGGTLSRRPVEQIADVMATVSAGFLNRYEIAWSLPEAPGAAHSARLQIFSRSGCADCTIDLEEPAL